MKKTLQKIFVKQEFYSAENIWELFKDVPRFAVIQLLKEVINNKSFQLYRNNMAGYIRYCNGYYLFQPAVYTDLTIPLAVRIAKFPVKRDVYLPKEYEAQEYVEEVQEIEYDPDITIPTIWADISGWVTQLSESDQYVLPPEGIQQKILRMASNQKILQAKYHSILQIIRWFHTSFHKSTNPNNDAFRRAVLFYLWDEWFTLKEQVELTYSYETKDSVEECIEENRFTGGDSPINRYMDPVNNKLYYTNNTGSECSSSTIRFVETQKGEAIRKITISTRTTSEIVYGFIVPKNKELVFKTAKAMNPGEKLQLGNECAIVSSVTGHMSTLNYLGETLLANGLTDFDLNSGMLYYKRKIQSSANLCILMNLVLRYMDNISLSNKRWFFRPVLAYYCGHKGINRAGRD
jgi:hypothetical protein